VQRREREGNEKEGKGIKGCKGETRHTNPSLLPALVQIEIVN